MRRFYIFVALTFTFEIEVYEEYKIFQSVKNAQDLVFGTQNFWVPESDKITMLSEILVPSSFVEATGIGLIVGNASF